MIVGAGASCEAGLPSGDALKGRIASLLDIRFEDGWNQNSGDHQITQAFRDFSSSNGERGDINALLHKAWRIRDVVPAAAISIDNFLDAHRGDTQMELCGKLAIVKAILDAEKGSKLRDAERGMARFVLRDLVDTWYVGFFQMLTENVARADVADVFANVSIVTFNYDRCIERFLVQALTEYYEIEELESQRIIGKLTIHHPYGMVGALPWQDRQNGVAFGYSNTSLLNTSKQIKTFTEGLDDESLLSAIHQTVREAETVIFLGFAFHPSNMALLTPGGPCSAKRVFATTLGLSKADEQVIQNDIYRMLGIEFASDKLRQNMGPFMANLTGGEFFKQYFRSLSASAA